MPKLLKTILWILLLCDLGYSAWQHYHVPIGGDMAEILPVPGTGYYKILHDPFGINSILNNDFYPNPNRFFAHWSTAAYFLHVPLLLQNITGPVSSIYLSIAIIKTLIQALMIYLLAIYISNTGKLLNIRFIMAAVLVTPFFQTFGFCRTLGIIDQSAIYTFFYALPLGLLMLFFLPFFRIFYDKQEIKIGFAGIVLFILFAIFLSLNGPLVPGVVLIACPLALLCLGIKNYRAIAGSDRNILRSISSFTRIPLTIRIIFIAFCLLSLYSLFIGRHNSLNDYGSIPLLERYSRIPTGLVNLLTKKIAFPLLISSIIINLIIMNRNYKSGEGKKIIDLSKWIGIFAVVYILLLPFGGYREYREHIVRYDTIMPITIALIFLFGKTSLYLLESISVRIKPMYLIGISSVLLVFTVADQLNMNHYECERKALDTIAASKDDIVRLDCGCPVMDWKIVDDPAVSAANAELFRYWHVTTKKKLYYQSAQ
jgi:hypothetical protein